MFARLPQLNAIRAFESAARQGSFKAAAEELHVTPTAISHQIRGLEERLGVPLFQRTARSVVLTESGRRLAAAAHLSLQELAVALEDIGAEQSTLTVSTTAGFAALWLVPRLGSFQQANPGIDVRIQTSEVLEDLHRSQGIDIAIRYGPAEHAGEYLLAHETFGVYANPAHRGGRGSRPATVRRARLIETRWRNPSLPPRGWKAWLERYAPKGQQPAVQAFDQEHHAVHAAMAGQGILLASDVLVQTGLENGWLRALHPECRIPGFGYYWAAPSHRAETLKAAAFVQWLQQQLPAR